MKIIALTSCVKMNVKLIKNKNIKLKYKKYIYHFVSFCAVHIRVPLSIISFQTRWQATLEHNKQQAPHVSTYLKYLRDIFIFFKDALPCKRYE